MGRDPGQIMALQNNVPGIGLLQPCNEAQQRRLAASGWAKQANYFTLLDLERDFSYGRGLRNEELADPSNIQKCHRARTLLHPF